MCALCNDGSCHRHTDDHHQLLECHCGCAFDCYPVVHLSIASVRISTHSTNEARHHISFAVLFLLSIRYTVIGMHSLESSSRSRMFQSMANTLEGRAVIQAFEKLEEFRNEYENA